MKIKINIIKFSTLSLLLFSNLYASQSVSVGVVYPDMREPYKTVFSSIVSGIKDTHGLSVNELPLGDVDTTDSISEWILSNDMKSVIALGQKGVSRTRDFPQNVHAIVGAILNPPDKLNLISGIALSPSPAALFTRLRKLAPTVKHVTVVYNDAVSGWLMPFAEVAAKDQGLSFSAVQVNDIREAANIYRDLIAKNPDSKHAIWLPHDEVTADSKVILPYILKEAWDKNIIVFSSNPSYVSRGVLFALYPDNVGMGRSLGKLAMDQAANPLKKQSVQPLNDLLIAVNIRTAEHLGLRISPSDKRSFDLMFPPPR